MAKERLTLYDKYGNVVEYDVSTEDVTLDNEGGKSLKQKLAEVDEGIGEQVKKVVFNGTTKNASNGSIDLGNQMQPDWNESSQSYPSYIRNKPNVVTGIRIGSSGGTMEPTNGVVTLPESEGGTVECDPAMSSTSEKPVQNKVIKAYVDAVSQRVDTLIGSGNVQGAIDTFNEVVAFLNGINSSDTLAAKLALKANTSDVYTKTQTDTLLSGKQNTLTFDNAPTAGSDNPVKSGGIKTALDNLLQNLHIGQNGNWYVGQTDTNIQAQGPAGNVNITDASDLVTILVNDLTTGGGGNILSAEMGKILKVAITTLIDSMGEYCFPNGRPTLSFETPKWNVTQNLTNVDTDFSALRIDKDGELTIHLTAQSGYDIDTVAVMMGLVDVTTNYYSYSSTTKIGTIDIPQVTGDVVITANVKFEEVGNYAQRSHLVFQLDGIKKGPTSGKWTDLIGGVVWDNHGATELTDSWQFDGTTYLSSEGMTQMSNKNHTIEVVFESTKTASTGYHVFTDGGKMVMNYTPSYQNHCWFIAKGLSDNSFKGAIDLGTIGSDNGQGKKIVSIKGVTSGYGGYVNGARKTSESVVYGTGTKALIGGSWSGSTDSFNDTLNFIGKVYAIRIYDCELTDAEILANQKEDNTRFNLGITALNS